jgi:hypothetical protein
VVTFTLLSTFIYAFNAYLILKMSDPSQVERDSAITRLVFAKRQESENELVWEQELFEQNSKLFGE